MNTSEKIPPIARISEAEFEAEVLRSKLPVLVVFRVKWSQACQAFEPILQEVARAWCEKGKVVELNADDCPYLSLSYDIHSVPTVLFFIEGQPRLCIVGTATKEAILAKLNDLSAHRNSESCAGGHSGAQNPSGKGKKDDV